ENVRIEGGGYRIEDLPDSRAAVRARIALLGIDGASIGEERDPKVGRSPFDRMRPLSELPGALSGVVLRLAGHGLQRDQHRPPALAQIEVVEQRALIDCQTVADVRPRKPGCTKGTASELDGHEARRDAAHPVAFRPVDL